MRLVLRTTVVMVALVGCNRVQVTEFTSIDSTGVTLAQVETEAGAVTYDGSGPNGVEEFRIDSVKWGRGSRRTRAEDRANQSRLDINVIEEVFQAIGSGPNRSGVDIDVVGPGLIHTDVYSGSGRAEVSNVEGIHRLEGTTLFGRNIVGEGDFFGQGGRVDLEIIPYVDGAIILVDSDGGDVNLGLPFGYDYDLTVTTDIDHTIAVEELGFDTLLFDEGLVLGRRGFRDIRVDVFVRDGDAFVYSL